MANSISTIMTWEEHGAEVGMLVDVRGRYLGNWCRGFEVAEILYGGPGTANFRPERAARHLPLRRGPSGPAGSGPVQITGVFGRRRLAGYLNVTGYPTWVTPTSWRWASREVSWKAFRSV